MIIKERQSNMSDATKQRLFLIGLGVALILFFGFVFYFANWMQTSGAECMADPISYYEIATDQLCYCNEGLGWLRG